MTVKKRTEPDWAELRTFAVLARYGTLSAAARVLKVDHATIGRRIKSLETTLNVRLVQRRPRGYTLTDAGEKVLQVAAAMERASASLTAIENELPHGEVRITASPSLCDGFLAAHMTGLTTRHKTLSVSLLSGLRPLSLAHHEADIAIRLGKLADSDAVGRKIASLSLGIFANARRAAEIAKGSPTPLVTFDEANASLPEAQILAAHYDGHRVAFRASSQMAQAEAAADGMGLALLPWFIARRFPALQSIRSEISLPKRDVWLLCRRDDKQSWPVGPTRDFLIELFLRERALFAP